MNRFIRATFNKKAIVILLTVFLIGSTSVVKAEVSPDRFRVSGDLVEKGDVLPFGYQVSDDSLYIVYLADQDENNVVELYSFNVKTKVRVKLNPEMQSNRDVEEGFIVSRDSSTVYYRSDHEIAGVNRLYRVPINGGASTLLNPDSDGPEFSSLTQSASGKYLVYHDQGLDTLNAFNADSGISSVLDTSKESEDLLVGLFSPLAIAPDDSIVVFLARDSDGFTSYYKTPLESGEKGELSSVKDSDTRIYQDLFNSNRGQLLTFSPDSSRLILGGYSSVSIQNDSFAWYVVSLLNTDEGLVRISPFSVSQSGFLVSSDFEIMVYGVHEFSAASSEIGRFADELYSSTIGAGTWRKISRDIPFESENLLFRINSFVLSSDASYVVYASYGLGINSIEDESGGVYKVSILGDEFQTLSLPDSRISSLSIGNFIGDSDDLLLSVRYKRGSRSEKLSISSDTGDQTLLTLPTPFAGSRGSGSFRRSLLTPDASKLIIFADRDRENTQELYAIHLDGSGRARLSQGLKPGHDVDDFLLSPDGQYVVYRTDDGVLNDLGLFVASTAIEPTSTDQFCFSIKAENENVLHICI